MKIEKGQFWRNKHQRQVVEILDIEKNTSKMVEVKVNFWYPFDNDRAHMLNVTPKALKVPKNEFNQWVLVDFDRI